METDLTASTFRNVLRDVEHDEAEAIDALCAVLERVEESRDFSCFSELRRVLKEWQHRPPRGIVDDLMRIRKTLECQDHART